MTALSTRLFLGATLFASAAFADLVPASPFEVNINGTGFGNVSTLITLQTANGQTNNEAGCIGFANSTTGCGITQNGKIKNTSSTEPLPTGASASDLRFVFNASEPSGDSIDLTSLQVSFYGTSATPLFTASLGSGLTLTSTQPGMGNSGFVFELDSTEAKAVQNDWSLISAIGAGFSATGATGGPDTLFLETAFSSVPEPRESSFLLAMLIGAALLVRRRLNQV